MFRGSPSAGTWTRAPIESELKMASRSREDACFRPLDCSILGRSTLDEWCSGVEEAQDSEDAAVVGLRDGQVELPGAQHREGGIEIVGDPVPGALVGRGVPSGAPPGMGVVTQPAGPGRSRCRCRSW